MEVKFDSVIKYEREFYNLKLKMISMSNFQRDEYWINVYQDLMNSDGFNNINNLPLLLALIHPDFCFKNGVSFLYSPILQINRTSRFTSGIRNTDTCQINKIFGEACVFSQVYSNERVQADHYWPSSLGGPSISDNRLLLCKNHNSMKSNNVFFFNWTTIPSWLFNQLNNIYSLKV